MGVEKDKEGCARAIAAFPLSYRRHQEEQHTICRGSYMKCCRFVWLDVAGDNATGGGDDAGCCRLACWLKIRCMFV